MQLQKIKIAKTMSHCRHSPNVQPMWGIKAPPKTDAFSGALIPLSCAKSSAVFMYATIVSG